MSEKVWQPIKVCFCEHIGQEIAFEAELVFPFDLMPDQNPRLSHTVVLKGWHVIRKPVQAVCGRVRTRWLTHSRRREKIIQSPAPLITGRTFLF